MTFTEYMAAFNKSLEDLQGQDAVREMTLLGEDANAIISRRMINNGKFASGKTYQYSTSPMLANRSSFINQAGYNKIAGTKSKRKELTWVTIKKGNKNIRLFEIPGGYSEFRELNGRQTKYVDLSFSGRMWKNIQVIPGSITNISVIVGALAEENRKKLEGNGDRFEPVLNLSVQETQRLGERYKLFVQNVFAKNGIK